MRKLLILVAFGFLFCQTSQAAVVNVQHCTLKAGTSTISVSCTFGSNVTSGNFVYCQLEHINVGNTAPTFVTWSGVGGTWVADFNEQGFGLHGWWYGGYALGVTGGSKVVTATYDGVTNIMNPGLACDEFSGIPGAFVISDVPLNSVGTAISSHSVVTTANGNFIFGTMISTSAITVGAGFTQAASQTSADAQMNEWQTQSTAGSIAATGTTTAGSSAGHIIVFGFSGNHPYFPQIK